MTNSVEEQAGLCPKERDQLQREADLVVDDMFAELFVKFARAIADVPAGAVDVKVCICGD